MKVYLGAESIISPSGNAEECFDKIKDGIAGVKIMRAEVLTRRVSVYRHLTSQFFIHAVVEKCHSSVGKMF